MHERVSLVASPVWDLPCASGYYYSVIIAHRRNSGMSPADFSGRRLAYNDAKSQSGWAAPLDWALGNAVTFADYLHTGAHRGSARAVADGAADIAAIDAVTWAMIRRWDRFSDRLIEVAYTAHTPALPYIAAPGADVLALRQALGDAIAALSRSDRTTLCLRGVTFLPARFYLAIATPPPPPD
ncbi:MAG: PhnD/SsuA/transferrin family substrate-binding protein [Rhodobacter sp.]|nr:PhnD/SsuA/transferrin family substrate-binding protein [Rhodobacter sp.]